MILLWVSGLEIYLQVMSQTSAGHRYSSPLKNSPRKITAHRGGHCHKQRFLKLRVSLVVDFRSIPFKSRGETNLLLLPQCHLCPGGPCQHKEKTEINKMYEDGKVESKTAMIAHDTFVSLKNKINNKKIWGQMVRICNWVQRRYYICDQYPQINCISIYRKRAAWSYYIRKDIFMYVMRNLRDLENIFHKSVEKYKNGWEDLKKILHSRVSMKNVVLNDFHLSGSQFQFFELMSLVFISILLNKYHLFTHKIEKNR